jgi:hypothetical protein
MRTARLNQGENPMSKAQAKQLISEHLTGRGNGYYWPKLQEEKVATGLTVRIDSPDLIYQAQANLCGMASFVHDLVETDPVMYAWVGIHLFKNAAAKLGRGERGMVIKASVDTRSSPLPPGMNHADWVLLASLRDHSNKVLKYAYNAKIPLLSDIPILGLLGQPFIAEPIAAINWPADLETLLRAAGFKHVSNQADTTSLAGYASMERMSKFYEAGYQVMMLISNSMLDGGKPTATAEHWVTLESKIDENLFGIKTSPPSSGVTFTIFNPAKRAKWRVPGTPGTYLPLRQFLDNYYGFVAAR